MLALDLLKKGGPYVAILALGTLLAIDHYRLVACTAERRAADAANASYKVMVDQENRAVEKENAVLRTKEKAMEVFTERMLKQDAALQDQSHKLLIHPPKGDCKQLMGWLAVSLK